MRGSNLTRAVLLTKSVEKYCHYLTSFTTNYRGISAKSPGGVGFFSTYFRYG